MREQQRNDARATSTRRRVLYRTIMLTMLLALSAASLARAQPVEPATYEDLSGFFRGMASRSATLYVATRTGLFAYESAPLPGRARGRFRVVARGDIYALQGWSDQVVFRTDSDKAGQVQVFRGFDAPLRTIPEVLGPPLVLEEVDGKPCIAGQRVEDGPRRGSVDRLGRCMLPSELWPSNARLLFVRVFDGRVVFALRTGNVYTLTVADPVQGPYAVRTFSSEILPPLALEQTLLVSTNAGWTSTPAETWTLTRGDAALRYLGAFARSSYRRAARLGDRWYYASQTATSGEELWRTDGTAEGTRMVADLAPGSASSAPDFMTTFRGVLYFAASGWQGNELYRSDGSEAGTSVLRDLNPRGDATPKLLTAADDRLYFVASNSLWESDGTETGTRNLRAVRHPGSPDSLVAMGDALYFQAQDGLWPRSIWRAHEGKMALVAAPSDGAQPVVDGDVKDVWIDYNQTALKDATGDVAATDPLDLVTAEVTARGETAYVRYTTARPLDFARNALRMQVFFDADQDAATGYREADAEFAVGAEFLLRGDMLLRYAGTGRDWSWTPVTTAKWASVGNAVELSFDAGAIPSPSPIGSDVLLRADNPGKDDYLH